MLTSKRMTLNPLLESTEGIHLTAYLVNRGNLVDLKSQLREVINQSYEWLNPVMGLEERNKFLEPLDSLLFDARIFNEMKGNIGLFRNKDSFRVLNVPVEVEQTCQVATSFHVKPLLRWLQNDQDFLMLGLKEDSVHLYQGNQDSFKLVDSILFPDFFRKKSVFANATSSRDFKREQAQQEEVLVWVSEWISQLTKVQKPKLFLAGEKSLVESLKSKLEYKKTVKTAVASEFSRHNVNEICQVVRKILKEDSKRLLEKALLEFRFAEEGKRTSKNIFQISKAVVRGRVRKLIVTDEISIFGKIDKKSGGISIHPFDLDHEDDDILDDLAQMVLSQGGEVIVAKRDEIPKGRPILAILDKDAEDLQSFEALYKGEFLKEKFG